MTSLFSKRSGHRQRRGGSKLTHLHVVFPMRWSMFVGPVGSLTTPAPGFGVRVCIRVCGFHLVFFNRASAKTYCQVEDMIQQGYVFSSGPLVFAALNQIPHPNRTPGNASWREHCFHHRSSQRQVFPHPHGVKSHVSPLPSHGTI